MLLFDCNHYTVIIVAAVFAVLLCCHWLLYYNNIFTLDIAYFLTTHAYTTQHSAECDGIVEVQNSDGKCRACMYVDMARRAGNGLMGHGLMVEWVRF